MKTLLLVLALSISSINFAHGEDLREEFRTNFSSLDLSLEIPKLKKYKIIVLRGLFNNYVSQLSDALVSVGVPIQDKKYAPWTREVDFFNKAGIESIIAPVQTEIGPERNGDTLANVIKLSEKPVIIISHSKGGVDVLYGLTFHPEVWPKVAGWINIQSPVYGTELADQFLENKIGEFALKGLLLDLMGGQWPAIQTLTVKNMDAFHRKNGEMVNKLVKNVPILSLATFFDVKSPFEELLLPLSEKSAFSILNRILSGFNKTPNDGFTPVSRACLKGTHCLVLGKIDHGSLVADLEPFYTFNKSTRVKFIFSLLEMLDSRMK